MPLSRALKLTEGGLLIPLASGPLAHPIPPRSDGLTLFLPSKTGHDMHHCRFETCYARFDRPGCEVDGVSLGPQAPTPFSLIPDETPFQLTHSTPLVIGCQDTFVPFTLWRRMMI
ncbi:hypothetical protein AAG906_012077 [Vitis piasezkii]